MRESSAYQAILDEGREEGRVQGIRNVLLLQGRLKFGTPGPEVEAAIQTIDNLDRLERMSTRLLAVSTWQDLLATP